MNLHLILRQSCLAATVGLVIFSGCHHNSSKDSSLDGNYVISLADTTMDVKAIVKKADDLTTANRLNDAISLLTINLHRFKGVERASLLNERGTSFYMKDDKEKAISDFLIAHELDSTNVTYAMSIANAYESIESYSNAAFFAKKILDIQTATDTDRIVAKQIIDRYESAHAGR